MELRILAVAAVATLIAPASTLAQGLVGSDMWSKTGNDIRNTNDGYVGINVGSPESRLHIRGRTTLQGDLKMKGDTHSIIFPATNSPSPAPMMYLYNSGANNSSRMVLAHSPGYPDWGLEYNDSSDTFRFLRGGTSAFSVGGYISVDTNMFVNEDMYMNGNLNGSEGILMSGGNGNHALAFKSPNDSIVFPETTGANEPMIYLFETGTINQNRMVLSHSPDYDTWGLEYDDSRDEFHFRNSARTVLNVDLGSNRVAVASTSVSGAAEFQVGDAGDGSFAIANSWSLFSSRDHKKDIERLDGNECQEVLDEVMATPVFKFRYNEETEETDQRLGLIVEESPDRLLSPETKGVDLGRYVTALHAALKAQQESIEALEEEVARLRRDS